MCVTAQTMQFISLMPKPKDFITRVVGDVVYLSALVQKLSDDMDKLLDSYADIPTNYLMTQMNSITGSLSNITNRLNTVSQDAINETMGLGENTLDMVSELTDTVSMILGKESEDELEWTGDGFKQLNSADRAKQKVTDKKNQAMGAVQGVADTINGGLSDANKWVETLIKELREKMAKLNNIVDSGFKDVTGLSSVSTGAQKISQEVIYQDENKKTVEITSAVAASLDTVIKNFSIGKVVAVFAGVLTQSVIVRTGLDKLPPIDFESMLYKIRSDIEMTPEDMYKQYNALTNEAYRELEELGEIPEEERNYSAENYEEFLKEFDEDIKKQREDIRLYMKRTDIDNKAAQGTLSKREMRSAIKEVKKYRNKVKKAKQTSKLKDIIGEELDRFWEEAGYRSNALKSDWQSMMKQYQDCIAEIKGFFQNGGSCDMFIDDCCNAINKDFNDIKELCKNLGSQLICCSLKVAMPSDIGSVVPNPAYKISDFLMDIKTIFKFIKDIITLIIDILNNINKIARLMINGLYNLNEIIKQLMGMIGLEWLMNLIQEIIDAFSKNISEARKLLTNMLSPVYFSDTEEYEHTLEALEEYLENEKLEDKQKGYIKDAESLLKGISTTDKNARNLVSQITSASGDYDRDKIEAVIDELDDKGDIVVAYKSPIIKEIGKTTNVSDLTDGKPMDCDIKFIGWHFFHPNLDHTGNKYYSSLSPLLFPLGDLMKKIKSKIIKKASKKSHKNKGGITMLHNKSVGTILTKIDEAYAAFYWYTYYTEDLDKDCFEGKATENESFVDNIMRTENGSIVQVTDVNGQTLKVFVANANVRSGDYVTVNGQRYRVG